MTDQSTQPAEKTPEQVAVIEAFNASVDQATLAIYEQNKRLMELGASPAATALANAFGAADITAAIAAEHGQDTAAVDLMLNNLLEDMKRRAHAAFAHFSEQKAALAAEQEGN